MFVKPDSETCSRSLATIVDLTYTRIWEKCFRKVCELCTDVGVRCKQKIHILPLPRSAILTQNSSALLKIVFIKAMVNQFNAVTLNLEVYLYLTILDLT